MQDIAAAPAGPFDRAEWFALLESAGHSPLVAVARQGSSAIALPLTHVDGRMEAVRNWYTFTWRPLGTLDGDLIAAVARDLRARTARVTLWPVPNEDGVASRLAGGFRSAGWSVRCTPCDHNHVIDVAGRSFAEYWSGRPGQLRTTYKRKSKKVTVDLYDRFKDGAWNAYEAIYRESWKPAEGDAALLRRFAQAEGAAGRVRLGVAWAEGEPVAAQFWTVENRVAYIHKLAHRESARHLSAGTILTAALFERVIDADRVNQIDFGTGNDPYKRDWMERDRPRYRIDCLDPRQPRAWLPLAKRALARPSRGG